MKRTKYNPATANFYYLNSTGSKGVRIDTNGNRETIPVSFDDGKTIQQRSVFYWEQIGNFSNPVIRDSRSRKAIMVFPDSQVDVTYYAPFKNEKARDTSDGS